MAAIYVGVNNQAKKIKKFYVGVNGVAKEVKKGYIGVNGVAKLFYTSSLLPSTYQAVEYLLNSGGTQYIKTGVYPSSDTTCIIDMSFSEDNPGQILFASAYYSTSPTVSIYYYVSNGTDRYSKDKLQVMFGSGQYVDILIVSDFVYSLDTRYSIELRKGGSVYINNVLQGTFASTFTSPHEMYLWGHYYASGGGVYISKEGPRIYHFEVWNNSTKIRDMYPCYRKSDNVAGMYDIINNIFYTNSGTGTFYKGPDIEL